MALAPASPRTAIPPPLPLWERYTYLWLLTVLLLLGAAASAWRMGEQLSRGLAFISRAQQAQQALAVLLRDVVDLESGQRGLLLTGDPAYREQYTLAEGALDAQFQAVDDLLSDDASLHGRLIDVQAALSRKRGEVAASLALYDSKGRDAALDVVRTELGRDAMEEMRANLAGLSASLSGAIAERQNTLGGIVFARNVTLFTALGLAVMASLAGAGLMRRHVLALRAGDEAREDARRARQESREKSLFVANMSHEIRTPMNAILGFGQLLVEQAPDAQQRGYATAIVGSGRALLHLINDVLDLARIEAGKLEVHPAPMNLRVTLEDTVALLAQTAAERGLPLAAEVDASVPPGLLLDEARVRQILFNLVGTALRRGAGVRVRAYAEAAGETRVTCHVDIESGEAPARNDAEFPLAPGGDGAGLGLGISRRLARLMGGDIAFDEAGTPTRLRLTLPGVPLAVADAADARAPGRLDDLPALTLLVVDDIALNRQLIDALFQSTPHRLYFADGGAAGVELARLHRPDVVLMDLNMPGMDGVQALAAIRADATLAQVQVIALTAAGPEADEARTRAGFDGFLRKPVTREQLADELARLRPGPAAPPTAPLDLARARAVLPRLQALADDRLAALRGSLAVGDCARFAADVAQLAQECGAADLADYAQRLQHAADQFDPAALQRALDEFPEQILRLAQPSDLDSV